MVGMHLTKTRGGITTLTSGILGSRLIEKYDVTYIESQIEEGSTFEKLFAALLALIKFVYKCVFERPHLAYVHVGCSASLYREPTFALLASIVGIKVISHLHAGDLSEFLSRQPGLGRTYIRRALRRSSMMIAVSNESAAQMTKMLGPANISIIPNAIDTTWLEDPPQQLLTRDVEGPTRILFVGAAGRLKGEGPCEGT